MIDSPRDPYAESAAGRNQSAVLTTLGCFVILLITVQVPPDAWLTNLTKNYLAIHILLEFIGILVSFGICTVGFATYHNARANDILVLSIAGFACGWLDLGHTLSFTGMPDFVGPSGPNKAIDFWLASRFTGATAFLYVALSKPRESRIPYLQNALLLLATIWCALCFWIILFRIEWLPVMFVQGEGLKPTKIILEWGAVIVSGLASFVFFVRAGRSRNVSFSWIGCASALYAMAGFYFTIYRDFDDVFNFLGHIYKAVAFIFLYRAVFVECVSKPYDEITRLAHEASLANASKSRFLANVSHEFRTPLGIITGFTDLIMNSKPLSTEVEEWARLIDRNARQLNLLIDDLLDLAKAESEVVSLDFSHFSLEGVTREVVESFRPKVAEKKLQISVAAPVAVGAIVSDELRFRQILTNVIGNAVKFTNQGGIQVSLRRTSEDQVEISVRDSGLGISSEDVTKLFQPFAQADNPLRRRFGGTGLGLVISRKLAQILGGDLILNKTSLGEGSTFVILIEDASKKFPTSRAKTSQDVASGIPDFKRSRILVAEDSPDNQTLIRHYLAPTGVTVVFANNGLEAKTQALKNHFDLILMDIQMPEMDGFEATAGLRAAHWEGPILAFTAHALQPERERAMASGFDDYLVKPISKAALWQKLSKHLSL